MKDIHSPLLGEFYKLVYKFFVAMSSWITCSTCAPCLVTCDRVCLFCVGNIGLIWTTSWVPFNFGISFCPFISWALVPIISIILYPPLAQMKSYLNCYCYYL